MTRHELINEPSDADAPEWARFKAQDGDGLWGWYEEKPQPYVGAWTFSGRYAYGGKGRIPAGHDWRETLKKIKPTRATPDGPTGPASSSVADTSGDDTNQPQYDPDAVAFNSDTINPSHYRVGKVECIDALESATVNKRGIEAVCTANAIKYLWRYESKGGIEDVRKARWYLDRLAKHLGE